MIEIVSATRFSESEFWDRSALGLSLKRLAWDTRINCAIAFENQSALAHGFNERIRAPDSDEILVFMHDDVWIDDHFLADRLIDGMKKFDLIGVAGNRRRLPSQPSWASTDGSLAWDDRSNLSGSIAHGSQPFGNVSYFGPSPAACELLDGCFLAARKPMLKANAMLFDPVFDFHFYDLDICRSAKKNRLRVGTWPISLTHQSSGSFGSERWQHNFRTYLHKWGK